MSFRLLDACAPPKHRHHHHRGCGCHECKPQDCAPKRECTPKSCCND
ncbi:hypothetical protein WCD74_00125 [Actinomycetospora sp. OC33-EN08]|uniref:Metallothionein n=1 Tax=Actinomycetospora aurantiaca TaxID=3129233 RepID=A0ABU8MFN4_9PSEU